MRNTLLHTFLLTSLFSLFSFNYFAQQPDWQWVKQFGSNLNDNQNNYDEEIWNLQVDDSGNVYISGSVWGNVNIDSNSFSHNLYSQNGFLAKFNCSGDLLWYKNYFPNENGLIKSKTSDDFYFHDRNQIVKLSTNGDTTQLFHSISSGIRLMDVGNNGDIYTLTYGNNGWQYTNNHPINLDTTYLAVHDSTGSLISYTPIIHSITGYAPFYNTHIKLNNNGDIYIAGTTTPYTSLEVIGGDTINPNGTSSEGFIVKLDNSGNHIWTKQSSGGGSIYDLKINENNELIFAMGAYSFEGSNWIKRSGFTFAYNVMVMDSSGNVTYYDNLGQTPTISPVNQPYAISQHNERIGIAVVLSEQYSIQYGTMLSTTVNGSNLVNTPGFLEFDTIIDDGIQDQIIKSPMNGNYYGYSTQIEYDNIGNIYIAGRVPSSIQFNGQTLPFQGGDYDLFVAKWGIDSCPVPVVNTFVCAQPQQLAIQNVDSNSALASWVDSANTGSYTVQWGTAGFALGSGDSATTTNLSYNLTGLQPNTAYEVYARTNCTNELSNYSNAVSFTTDSLATTPPDTGTNPGDTTGIEALSAWKNQVKVYPNPANNQLVVAFGNNTDIKEITVFSITGSLIYQTSNITENQYFIETTNWPQGMYVLQITANNGTKENRRFSVGH